MKLLTLAAGLGSRVQDEEYIPKPLIEVKGKPLIVWALESFYPLRANGMLKEDDLIIAARENDLKEFSMEGRISAYLGSSIRFVSIQNLTLGPADTAYQTVVSLLENGEAHEDEPLIINDCDHHFNGSNLIPAIQAIKSIELPSALVCTAQKNPLDLSWSFVRERNGVITGLVEKPENYEDDSINYSEGLIGVYFFSSIANYIKIFNDRNRFGGIKDFFISHVIDHGICNSQIQKIAKVQIENFTSLGTKYLIEKAVSESRLGGNFRERGSVFLDLDGTIFRHDNGGGLGKFEFSGIPLLVDDEIPKWTQEMRAQGYFIVITSARPERIRSDLQYQLSAHGIVYDNLILGLPGGPRFLFNDMKDTLPCLPTSYSINYVRDFFPLVGARNLVDWTRNLYICNEYVGESAERTFLLRDEETYFIRKQSNRSENSKELINYQSKWLSLVKEILPKAIPNIIRTNVGSYDSIVYFDSEYLPNLVPLGERLLSIDEHTAELHLKDLMSLLCSLYDSFKMSSSGNMLYLNEVINEKGLAGFLSGLEQLKKYEDWQNKVYVNEEPLGNILENVKEVFQQQKLYKLLEKERNVETLIHGDPTLSNVFIDSENQIILLDPIGTRVLPRFSLGKSGLGRTHPFFDFVRIRLSLQESYERWKHEISVDKRGSDTNYSLVSNDMHQDLYDKFNNIWPAELKVQSEEVQEIIYLQTLCRILPYKAKKKPKEAFYLLGMIQKSCSKIRSLTN